MTFPVGPIDISVQAFLRGAWREFGPFTEIFDDFYTDVYEDVYGGRTRTNHNRLPYQEIVATHGRRDAFSAVSPARCSVEVWNGDGWLTPDDPRSPWWPDVAVGADLRIQVTPPGGEATTIVHEEISELLPEWPAGALSAGEHAKTTLVSSGVMRRLGSTARPLRSPLTRLVTASHNIGFVDGYWPMEDGPKSGSARAMVGSHDMALTAMDFASSTFLDGSEALPSGSTFGAWSTQVDGTTGTWTVEQFFEVPAPTLGQSALLMHVATTGTVAHWLVELLFDSGDEVPYLSIRGYTAAWANVVNVTDDELPEFFGVPVKLRLNVSSTAWSVTWQPVGQPLVFGGGAPLAMSPGAVRELSGRFDGLRLATGHAIVHRDRPDGWLVQGMEGWIGETALRRALRLSTEVGVTLFYLIADSVDEGIPMGIQRAKTYLELMQECADADGGILAETRASAPGLRFTTRMARYNRPVVMTLDASENGISNPFLPASDDQDIVNDVTVQRDGGSSRQAMIPQVNPLDPEYDPNHPKYDASFSVSLATDDLALDAAGWRLHVGTWKGMRYPQVTIDLAVRPDLMQTAITRSVGERIQIVNLPPQHPMETVDLLIEGRTYRISPQSFTVTFNCSPAGPWTVAVLEDDVYGRCDTAGCVLTSSIDATDTVFNVTTTDGPRWIASSEFPAEFPFDIWMFGERMTVTEIFGTGTEQQFTVTRAVNGISKTHNAGEALMLDKPAVLAR